LARAAAATSAAVLANTWSNPEDDFTVRFEFGDVVLGM
jgi:hypothetical protein